MTTKNNEISNQALINKVRKQEKKGHKEHSYLSKHRKKYLSHVKCFKCHNIGHYVFQFPKYNKEKNRKHKQGVESSILDGLAFKVNILFSTVSNFQLTQSLV